MLTPSQCGHTFCAVCLLKWFFSNLHDECGWWHGNLECPLCRAALPATDKQPGRKDWTCPFAPNRVGEEFLHNRLNALADILEPQSSILVEPSVNKGEGKGQVQRAEREPDILANIMPIFSDGGGTIWEWKKDGLSRLDWEKRTRLVSFLPMFIWFY
jgi:hypothetical protein